MLTLLLGHRDDAFGSARNYLIVFLKRTGGPALLDELN